jgi:NADH:ubiquinone oxidoreductase subunit 6 (subunit J)
VTDETPTGKSPAAKRPAAKRPAASSTAAGSTPAKRSTTARSTTPRSTAAKSAAAAVPPVESAPIITPPAAAAAAPAGWYPVAAGSAQQRWWDGTRWTDHVYDPATATPSVTATTTVAPLRAADGVTPGTAWFWLLAVGAPVLQLLELIPTSIWFNSFLNSIGSSLEDPTALFGAEFNAAYLVLLLCGFVIYAFCVVFAALDWRELTANGVPRPFHWAWSFFVFVVSCPAVYVIGRAVVAKRRTGTGMAPLWVYVGLQVLSWLGSLIFGIYILVQFVNLVNTGLDAATGNF